MIVYTDMVTGDEMMTDAFKKLPVLDDEGNPVEGLFEVESQVIVKGSTEVDIGCGNSFGGGGDDEAVDDAVEKVNNVIDSFNFSECPFGSKTEFKEYLKEYVVKLRGMFKEAGKPQPEIKAFMATAPGIVKFLLSKYNDLQFYVGASYDPQGAMSFSYYKEGATTPNFMFIEGGLKVEKF
ncbi:Mss4-like protein [Tribonema minus]|uniref:Mss4-like protein n=1 Tax=Tribonema minus TaxID=303371 RepID=A0A835YS00_9STRA|nr:Mss4-like protein [Tribonema minus]